MKLGGKFYAFGIGLAFSCLGGCASIKGAQDPVTTADLEKSVCPTGTQIEMSKSMAAADRPGYRDQVIADCVKAVNQHYYKYITDLRQESVSSNLTTDVLALGLSGGATLAKPATAKALSASSALVTGVGSSINKDVFYQQTLPAIVSAMDTRRAVVLAAILDSEKKDPQATAYTLTNAGLDIDAYQGAGNIYVAIGELTKTAGNTAAAAQTEVANRQVDRDVAYTAVKLDPATAARVQTLTDTVRKMSDRTKLDNAARDLGLPPNPAATIDQQRKDIVDAITAKVSKDAASISGLEITLKPYF